jgi:diguanylate cyclase (GGDEF)-like protein
MSVHPPPPPPPPDLSWAPDPSSAPDPAAPAPGCPSLPLTLLGATILALAASLTTAWRTRRQTAALRVQLRHARREARQDPLTGLPNRQAVLDALATGAVAMVGLLDLNDFKSVNDRHGHHVGDQLLIAVAGRLRAATGARASAARLSGDEFVVLWHQRPAAIWDEAAALLEQVCAPLTIDGHHLQPAVSLGLALYGPHLDGTALLAAADHAMYQGKRLSHRATPGGRSVSITRLYRDPYPPPPLDRRHSQRRRDPGRPPSSPSRRVPPAPAAEGAEVDCP